MTGANIDRNKLFVGNVVKEADSLSILTKLPSERLQSILFRTARIAAKGSSANPIFIPNLRAAINHLPPDKALQLFETSDINTLAWQELFVRCLKTTGAIHTKSDLATFIGRFLRQPMRDCEGKPMIHSAKLGTWINYYGRFIYRGYTCSSAPHSYHSLPSFLRNDFQRSVCAAGEAFSNAILPVMDRLNIGLLKGEDGGNVLSDCLGLIKRNLSPDDAALLLTIDKNLTGYDVFTGMGFRNNCPPTVGGLTDLLEIIGHVTEEMSVGIFDQTATALDNLIIRRFRGFPRLRVLCFYQAIGCGQSNCINCACDTFSSLRDQYNIHWSTYRSQLYECFGKVNIDYSQAATVTSSVLTNVAPLDPFLHYDQLKDTLAVIFTKDVEFAFYRCGDFWIIKYSGQSIALIHQKGLQYISILLRNPDKNITAVDLARSVGSLSIDPRFAREYQAMQKLPKLTDGITDDNLVRLSDDVERIRKSVSNAISRAKKSINNNCPPLARHLDNTLYIGNSCRYQPEPRIIWKTD